jgi:hypothetical protein
VIKFEQEKPIIKKEETDMKRISAACLLQTVVFQPKDDIGKDAAATLVKEEVAKYKANLERNRTNYKITEETARPDGSILIKIMRQYNSYKIGDYLS